MTYAWLGDTPPQQRWPRIEAAQVLDDGQSLGIFVREFDGTISAVRIDIDQLAD